VCLLALLPAGAAAQTGSAAPTGHRSGAKTTSRAFLVAPPPLLIVGGVYQPKRTCRPHEVSATATTRHSPDGVVAVVILTTRHACDIHVGDLDPTLFDADGNSLSVPVVADLDTTNPAQNPNWWPFTTLGFGWDGSWCGAPAATVVVPLKKGTVQAPLSGPQPGCSGTSTATIVPGTFGHPGDPVQSAPPEWRFLSASFHVPKVTRTPSLVHPTVTFTNSSDQPVVLGPRPTYAIGIHDKYGDGTEAAGLRRLPTRAAGRTVPAEGSLRVELPTQSIVDVYRDLRGRPVSVTFAMAGVPTATTTSTLDHTALRSFEGHCRLDGSTVPAGSTHRGKQCDSLRWRFAVEPRPGSRVLHLRWRGYCIPGRARVEKRQTRRSVVVAVTAIARSRPSCSEARGRVSVRLASRLGTRRVYHAATVP
jgi:hypothetical protein